MQAILNSLNQFWSNIRWRSLIVASFVGLMLLTNSANLQIADASVDASTQDRLDEVRAQGKQGRPRTTGQWQAEKEALEGRPGKVVERMAKEAADAADEAADTYAQTVKDATPGLESNGFPKDQ